MNKTFSKLLIAAVFINLSAVAPLAVAGPDFFQQQIVQRVMEAKQKLKAAKAAQGTEQQKLMEEHMQMLHEAMEQCREMRPKANMSAAERDEWYAEHQKLMDQMMDQMMEEHAAMKDMGCMDSD